MCKRWKWCHRIGDWISVWFSGNQPSHGWHRCPENLQYTHNKLGSDFLSLARWQQLFL